MSSSVQFYSIAQAPETGVWWLDGQFTSDNPATNSSLEYYMEWTLPMSPLDMTPLQVADIFRHEAWMYGQIQVLLQARPSIMVTRNGHLYRIVFNGLNIFGFNQCYINIYQIFDLSSANPTYPGAGGVHSVYIPIRPLLARFTAGYDIYGWMANQVLDACHHFQTWLGPLLQGMPTFNWTTAQDLAYTPPKSGMIPPRPTGAPLLAEEQAPEQIAA
jgi:hypothetical protein